MMILGEIKRGREIGYRAGARKYQWLACPDCGKGRWVAYYKGQPVSLRCRVCHGKQMAHPLAEKHQGWKGGRCRAHGYILIHMNPDDFFFPMADRNNKYVLEHRLVMAKYLGRNLHSWEIVHHRNHIRDDNRTENLQLVSDDRHKQITLLERKIAMLEQEKKGLLELLHNCRYRS